MPGEGSLQTEIIRVTEEVLDDRSIWDRTMIASPDHPPEVRKRHERLRQE